VEQCLRRFYTAGGLGEQIQIFNSKAFRNAPQTRNKRLISTINDDEQTIQGLQKRNHHTTSVIVVV
jgi:hypothetical protein